MSELKQPPNSTEAEQAVIGAVLARPEALADISLTADEFYRREHRIIWTAILELSSRRKPVDVVSLSEALSDSGELAEVGGINYLATIHSGFMSAANASHYAELISNKATRRRLISIAHSIADKGYNEADLQETIDYAQRSITEVQAVDSREPVDINSCMKEAVHALEQRHDRKEGLLGLATGFADIDKRTQGLRKGHLVVIAGRPGMGKTTLACNIAENAAAQDRFVISFSLEMSREELTAKTLCSLGKIDYEKYQDGKLAGDEWDKLSMAVAKMRNRKYFIDDDSNLTSALLLSRARRISQRVGRKPDLVVVDYLQLLRDKGEGVERITAITRNLKSAARELDCPLIALSQLSRKVEERKDRRPIASDLRESGSIEQDADLIYLLYRDEEYDDQTQHPGVAEAICAKWRFGKRGIDILSSAYLNLCRFESSSIRHIERAQPAKRRGGTFNYD